MFPTQSKVNRSSSLWLLPIVALVMLLVAYAIFAASKVQAQTPAGDFCIEGIVIDWEENPLSGWAITLTSDITIPGGITMSGGVTSATGVSTTISAFDPDDDDDEHWGPDNGYDKKGGPDSKHEGGPDYNNQNGPSHDDRNGPSYNDSKGGPKDGHKDEHGPEFSRNGREEEDDDELQAGEFEFQNLLGTAGVYTATIESRPGWEGVTPTTITFPIEVGQDGCVQIRFKMRRIVMVTVYKIDADHTPLGDWKIKAVPGPGNLFASPQTETTAATGTVTTTVGVSPTITGTAVFSLTPGLWIFTEMPPKQEKGEPREGYVPIVPPTGRQELLIEEDDGPLTLVFKNDLVTGCFIVRKLGSVGDDTSAPAALLPAYNVAGWGFKLLRADGTVARQGVTDANGEIRFDNLPLGPYTIVEEDRPGWAELSAIEQEYLVTGNNCDPGDPVVEFTNEQDDSGFCIEGRKIDANGGYGLAGWEITIEPLDEGGIELDSVVTDGLGNFAFDFPRDDYRVPGGLFEVCEEDQDGWVSVTGTCQTVRLPEWPSACVELKDFVNQQVGHGEDKKHDGKGGEPGYGNEPGKGGYGNEPDNGNHGNNGGYGHDGGQCSTYHVVKAGEGLYDIGREHNKTPQQMLDANPSIRDSEHQWVIEGQRVCIP